jgi:hypothetical protein
MYPSQPPPRRLAAEAQIAPLPRLEAPVIWAAPASAAMRSPAATRPRKVEQAPEEEHSAWPRAQAREQADSVSPQAQGAAMAEQARSTAPRPQVLEQGRSASPGSPVARFDSPLRMAVPVSESIRAPAPREGPDWPEQSA